MRLIVQRVANGRVMVNNEVYSSIERGMVVLVGMGREDGASDIDYACRKLVNMRLWEDAEGKAWTQTVRDISGEILLVSQFTLFGYLKGNKPNFHRALEAEQSRELFGQLVEKVREAYDGDRVKHGKFQAHCTVHIANDGPVTLALDSKDPNKK